MEPFQYKDRVFADFCTFVVCQVEAQIKNTDGTLLVRVQVIERVDAQEAAGCIADLVEDLPPERLLEQEPQPGEVVSVQELKELGAKELKLSNGMCVVFRHSELQEDQILLSVRLFSFPDPHANDG